MNHLSSLNALLALETKADVGVVKTDVRAFKDEIKSDMGGGGVQGRDEELYGGFQDEMKGALRDGIRSDVQVLTHNLKTV
ncbi:hypothetical protein ACLB2K_009091 [Fragaria x ananassa]